MHRCLPLIALAVLLCPAPAVLAQEVAKAKDSGGWVALLISFVLVIAVGIASFLTSRRSHQD